MVGARSYSVHGVSSPTELDWRNEDGTGYVPAGFTMGFDMSYWEKGSWHQGSRYPTSATPNLLYCLFLLRVVCFPLS